MEERTNLDRACDLQGIAARIDLVEVALTSFAKQGGAVSGAQEILAEAAERLRAIAEEIQPEAGGQ